MIDNNPMTNPAMFAISSTSPSRIEKNIYKEIATVQNDMTFPAWGGIYRQLDATLLARAGGKGIWLYDDVLRDAHAFAVIQNRIMTVLSYAWELKLPENASDLDIKAFEEVRNQLQNMPFDKVCEDLLYAILYGYSVGEVMWERENDRVVAKDILDRDQKRFYMDEFYQVRLRTIENQFPGETIPDRKFIWHTFGSRKRNPYGRGLGDKLWYLVHFKKELMKFWLSYGEKFASPTILVKLPAGATPDMQAKGLEAAQAISSEAELAIPEDLKPELLESRHHASAGVYQSYIAMLNEEISKCVLNESVTTSSGEHAARAAVATHNEVRLELVQADSNLLCDTLNNTLIKWIVELNFPGARAPRLSRDIASPEDLFKRAQRDQYVGTLGYRPTLAYIRRVYGPDWEEWDGAVGLGLSPANKTVANKSNPVFDTGTEDTGIENVSSDSNS